MVWQNYTDITGGLLSDSLATTIEVAGLADLQKRLQAHWDSFAPGYISNIRIKDNPYQDPRLPREWGGVSYYVVADFGGYTGQCIGMSNFYEE